METITLIIQILLTLFNLVFIWGAVKGGLSAAIGTMDFSIFFFILCFLGFIGNLIFIWGIL